MGPLQLQAGKKCQQSDIVHFSTIENPQTGPEHPGHIGCTHQLTAVPVDKHRHQIGIEHEGRAPQKSSHMTQSEKTKQHIPAHRGKHEMQELQEQAINVKQAERHTGIIETVQIGKCLDCRHTGKRPWLPERVDA